MSRDWFYYDNNSLISQFKVLLVYANSPMDNLMPVGISSLSGSLKRKGFQVKLFDSTPYLWTKNAGGERRESLQVVPFDYSLEGIEYKNTDVFSDFNLCIDDYSPNLIAVSTVESTFDFGLQLLRSIKERITPTIMGGPFTIFSPEYVIQQNCIDMICLGEGEHVLVNLCELMAKGECYHSIPGLWCKIKNSIIKNPFEKLVNLDALPFLDFSIFEPDRFYRPMSGKLYRMVPVEFSRGCIYNCSFCSAPSYANKFKECGNWYRQKKISQIIEEIYNYIKTYDIQYFYFVSETFLAMSEKNFLDFCIEYENIKVPFWFNTRPETINKEKISMLEKIGCHRMSVGIESGNENYRRKMLNRNITNERIITACNLVANSTIQLSVNNIIGFPDETRSMIFDTIAINRKIDADSHSCSIFQPYRGTPLYDYCIQRGYYDIDTLAPDLTISSPLHQPSITKEEIQGLYRTFPLYVKMSEEWFDKIKRSEQFDEEGNMFFEEISKIFQDYKKVIG